MLSTTHALEWCSVAMTFSLYPALHDIMSAGPSVWAHTCTKAWLMLLIHMAGSAHIINMEDMHTSTHEPAHACARGTSADGHCMENN